MSATLKQGATLRAVNQKFVRCSTHCGERPDCSPIPSKRPADSEVPLRPPLGWRPFAPLHRATTSDSGLEGGGWTFSASRGSNSAHRQLVGKKRLSHRPRSLGALQIDSLCPLIPT